MDRRTFNFLAGFALAAFGAPLSAKETQGVQARCKALELELGGRLGMIYLEPSGRRVLSYRADERFPMCSTFKWLAAAALLSRVDSGHVQLDRRLRFGRDELTQWSPVTQHHVGEEDMTLGQLCEAAIAQSDNTAANLILREIGGIAGWNSYVGSIGDAHTHLDRGEPMLNEALPGDVRDTTTPAAMAADLRRVLLEDELSPASREQLTQWMLSTAYRGPRLRAGLPKGWRLADKTGTGNSGTGTVGDVGVLWSPSGEPHVIAVYMTQARVSRERQEAAIAEIGHWARESG